MQVMKKLIRENSAIQARKENTITKMPEEKLPYPFLIVKLKKDEVFTLRENDNNSRVCLLSKGEFTLLTEKEINKLVLMREMKKSGKLNFSDVDPTIGEYIELNRLEHSYLQEENSMSFDQFQRMIGQPSQLSTSNNNMIEPDIELSINEDSTNLS